MLCLLEIVSDGAAAHVLLIVRKSKKKRAGRNLCARAWKSSPPQ
jgi:hypothetical protein